MQVGTGQYQLLVSATTTGAASHFTLDGGAGWSELTAAQDAQLQIGTTNTSTVQSPTNTITGLLPGVTLTVTQQTASPVTVSVVANPQAIGDKMKALIDAANAVISEVSTDTDTGMGGATSGKAGPLPGDYSVQNLAQQVRRIVSSAVGTLGSPAQIGLELSSGADGTVDGTIAFDENTFVSALKSNPTMVQQMVQNIPATTSGTTTTPSIDGIAKQLATLASQATDSVTGTLVTLANGEDAQAKSLQGQIDDWTTRLTLIQQQLTTTYTNMESMLSTLQSQQSWLTSMVNSLSGSSSSGSSKSSASVS
jgi:flagellar hook-associated protein 2